MTERSLQPIGLDEQALIARVRDWDVGAFEVVFALHYQRVLTFVTKYVIAPDVAEELTQDVFAWVWEQRAQWVVRGRFDQYLGGAARNRALNYLRAEGVVKRYAACRSPLEPDWPAPAPTPLEEQEAAERRALLRNAIAALPARRRQAVTLRVISRRRVNALIVEPLLYAMPYAWE